MDTQWNNDFSIGNQEIDNHHEELFQLASLLDSAIYERSADKINAIIIFLEGYVVTHFKEEEDLMKESDFSGYSEHKRDHERFKLRVAELRSIYNEGIKYAHLIFKVRLFLDDLIHHIKTVDIKIADLEH